MLVSRSNAPEHMELMDCISGSSSKRSATSSAHSSCVVAARDSVSDRNEALSNANAKVEDSLCLLLEAEE